MDGSTLKLLHQIDIHITVSAFVGGYSLLNRYNQVVETWINRDLDVSVVSM
jgi:hypothetical protein